MNFTIISLNDYPDRMEEAAAWFSGKWGIPKEVYLDSMRASLQGPVPNWYIACDGKILGGLGVIENDFHERKDLAPNICAVYTERECRGQKIAGALLNRACEDLKKAGFKRVYLLTDHDSFYERYGWHFLCDVKGNDGDISRGYEYEQICDERIGTTLTVTVDRPLGSSHPKYPEHIYPLNYGYIEGMTGGDGEEQDAYILGVDQPVRRFTGKVIAVVKRFDDNEDKLVVAPENTTFSLEEIRGKIWFQERYFHSAVIL